MREEPRKGFKVLDRREGDAAEEREAEKQEQKRLAEEVALQQEQRRLRLAEQRALLMKCPNCKWRKPARRFLQIQNKNMPPFIACPNCGSVFLHTDYVKNVLKTLAEREKETGSPAIMKVSKGKNPDQAA